jgi:hypothetical protein
VIALLCVTACVATSGALTIPRLERNHAKWDGKRVEVRGWSTGCSEDWNVCGLAASPDLLPAKGYVQFAATPDLYRQLDGRSGKLVTISGIYQAGCTGHRDTAEEICFTGDAFADFEDVKILSVSAGS